MSNHFKISMIKSLIRILGAIISIVKKNLLVLAISVLVSELVGIVEELFENE